MRSTVDFLWILALLAIGSPEPVMGQEVPPPTSEQGQPLRVFLDCERCDFDFFRREVTFISYVRDRMDAELHVLVTSQSTGAGGNEYTLEFIGLRDWNGAQDTLRYVSQPDETDDETRSGLARTFSLGLVRFVAPTKLGDRLKVQFLDAEEGTSRVELDDPWNLWVLRIRVSGEVNGESQQRSRWAMGSFSAGRVTEELKVNLTANGDWDQRHVELSEGEEEYRSRNYRVGGVVVWGLSPRWSFGGSASATGSTRLNQDLTLRAGPALEYNIFPYAESNHRQITFLYKAEVASFDYEEVTLFDRNSETRFEQSLQIASTFEQPWGELDFSLEGSNFLEDFRKHRLELYSRIEVRLMRGLSLDIRGGASRVKDQIYKPRAGISDEDILLRRRELGTDYTYSLDVGFNYTFGSLFNNVVNPRMSSMGGGYRH